jgi:CheY-like chemotaxis protein
MLQRLWTFSSPRKGIILESIRADQGPSKGRILVVEDDRSSRTALVSLLRLCGFEALPAANVQEALARLADSPNCLILDLMLPDGNGSEVLAQVRKQRLPIQVVVTTGAMQWEQMLRNSPAPPDVVLQKPVNYRELIDWLQSHC